jgi:hypothetical protein
MDAITLVDVGLKTWPDGQMLATRRQVDAPGLHHFPIGSDQHDTAGVALEDHHHVLGCLQRLINGHQDVGENWRGQIIEQQA